MQLQQHQKNSFDEHFVSILEIMPPRRYKQLKEHILNTNETLGNLYLYMKQEMEIEQSIRYQVLDLVETYDGFGGDFSS